ncbi:cytochrome P450 [Halieaceae bacterium]|nr:cytochrome P450 [Halieaceae bacterium]
MSYFAYHLRRLALSYSLEGMMRFNAWRISLGEFKAGLSVTSEPFPENPTCPEDFRPLENACFQHPYNFYKMIRDDYPVYQLPNGIFCISRYEDIVELSRNTDTFSSSSQGVVAGLKPGQDIVKKIKELKRFGDLGLVPADVLATTDPPAHTVERKVGHSGLNARFVKSLEPEIEKLCHEMMGKFMNTGKVEFMQEFGWRLPMILIIRLLGLPEKDFEMIKAWCVHGVNSQSGIASKSDLVRSQAAMFAFVRYCWSQYLKAKRDPGEGLMGKLVMAAKDPDSPFDDKLAVSTIFQLIIAGSDSSATSMGNALKMLIENPELQKEISDDLDNKLPAFVEEVFRLEAAFQGMFRWTKKDAELHGVKLPEASRIFLMWASGNRDERFWDDPGVINLNRKNGKKHLTFGHGIHACIGRELARMEIRIVLREFLKRTENMYIDGDAPFVASMFARTLLSLPVCFDSRPQIELDNSIERAA